MKYAVVGVGGVGGYFGARLAADGNEVAFIARGAQRKAMESEGLTVLSANGDVRLDSPWVTEDMSEVGFCDYVLFCVKLWDVDAAAEQIRPIVARDTAVLPFQNGVSVEDRLGEILAPGNVMGATAQIAAVIERPGVIRHSGTMARLVFGERDGSESWRLDGLLAACESCGIEAKASREIDKEIWRKFVFLAPMAGATCFYRSPIGPILAAPDRRARLAALIAEAVAVGRAKGIDLAPDTAEQTLGFMDGLPGDMKTSMLGDLEHGRRLELEWLNGEIVRLGRELGVPTPENAAVTEALAPYKMGDAADR
jgi:2-dehydropantoate 2-reductase